MSSKRLLFAGACAFTPVLLFAVWLHFQPWALPDKISAWDPFVKAIGIAGAIVAGLASLEKFLDQRQRELLRMTLDIERPLQEARTATYTQAIRAASTLATAAALNGTQEQEAKSAFKRLYWGEMARFEGPDVEDAMVQFGMAIDEWEKTGSKSGEVERLSLQLVSACRKELDALRARYSAIEHRYESLLGKK